MDGAFFVYFDRFFKNEEIQNHEIDFLLNRNLFYLTDF